VSNSENNPVGHYADKYREVGISSGNQALTRWAFVGTNSKNELITSGLPVIRPEIEEAPEWALASRTMPSSCPPEDMEWRYHPSGF
jgi:hypothetical protein